MSPETGPAPLIATALRRRCPRCGRGGVFSGYLRVVDHCADCGLALASNDSADGPAVFLLFIIGIVLPFSLARRVEKGQGRWLVYLHFLKRSLMLILLGSIPGGVLHFTHWPFLGGVLAHIGLCYFFAALLVFHTKWKTRAIAVVCFLVLYWLALILIPVPGHGAGVFTEEGSLASLSLRISVMM